MTLANDSILVSPGSGATVATHLVGSKEHQVVILAGPDGHIIGSTEKYKLYQQPRVTTAAAKDFFDLFNAAGSGKKIRLWGLYPILQVTAANALFSFHFASLVTSAVGTGGTEHTYKSATVPLTAGAVDITPLVTGNANLPAQITARSLPTGGATVAYHMFDFFLYMEELNNHSLIQYQNLVPIIGTREADSIDLVEGEGMKVRQITATASTGCSIGFLAVFDLV